MSSVYATTCATCIGLLVLGTSGCDDDRPPPPRPLKQRGASKQVAKTTPPETGDETARPSGNPAGSGSTAAVADREQARAQADDPRDEGPDLEGELRSAVAGAQSCLPTDDPSLPERVRVSVTAHLSTTGRITRASASGSGLPSEATECIEKRIESARLSPPGPGGSSASTTVTWRFEKREPETKAEAGGGEPEPPSSGSWIEGPGGTRVEPSGGQEPTGPGGQPIEGPSGTPIGE